MRKFDFLVFCVALYGTLSLADFHSSNADASEINDIDTICKKPIAENVVLPIKEVPSVSKPSSKEEMVVDDKPTNTITHVDVTCYQPLTSQCDSDPLITADMSKIDLRKLKRGSIKWCAISRDLLWLIPMGSKVHIEGHGTYEVHDVLNKRYTHRMDILIHPSDETRYHENKVKVTLL